MFFKCILVDKTKSEHKKNIKQHTNLRRKRMRVRMMMIMKMRNRRRGRGRILG